MTKKDLIREIYTLAFPKKPTETIIKLNINRGKYTITKLWNVSDGLIVFISDGYSEIPAYIDCLRTIDQIFIYRKLLKMDIFYNMVESYPDKNIFDIVSLTDNIFNTLTKRKRKTVHVN